MPTTIGGSTTIINALPSHRGWHSTGQLLSAPWVLVLVAALASIAYVGGIGVGFVSDDHYWLLSATQGAWRRAFDLVPHSSAVPFETVLHSVKYQLFGFNALGFHLFDLGAHILVCFLVYRLARIAGLPSPAAGAAALLGAVAAAPSQAVFWTSADEHAWATLLAFAALALYVEYRTRGRRLLLAAAIVLAGIAALTKVEGTAVLFGVLAYELLWRSPDHSWSRQAARALALRVAPFAVPAGLFVAWELTATDRLRSVSRLGPNMVLRAFEVVRAIVLPYTPADLLAPAHTNRALAWLSAVAAVAAAALLVAGIAAAFARPSVVGGLGLLWIGPQLPTWSLTDPLQSRYTYFAAMVLFIVAASGGVVLLDWWVARKLPRRLLRPLIAIALVGMLAIGIRETSQSSTALRAAERESRAFSTAVLEDHPVLAPGLTIYLIGSPLDNGSATWVFADPRLGRQINDWLGRETKNNRRVIEHAPSVEAVGLLRHGVSPILIYEREPSGRYVERFP